MSIIELKWESIDLIDKDANAIFNNATITGTLTATIPASYGRYVTLPDTDNSSFVPVPNTIYSNSLLTANRTFTFNDAALAAAYPDMAIGDYFFFYTESFFGGGSHSMVWGCSGTGVESSYIDNIYWASGINTSQNDSRLMGIKKTNASYPIFSVFRQNA